MVILPNPQMGRPRPQNTHQVHGRAGPNPAASVVTFGDGRGTLSFSVSGGDRPRDVHHPGRAGAGLGWPRWEVCAGDAESWICLWRNKVRGGLG